MDDDFFDIPVRDSFKKFLLLSKERGFDHPKQVKIDHPNFYYVDNGGAEAYPVIVFERSVWKEPSEGQIAEYRKNKAVVESLGGMMIKSEYQLVGKNDPFTEQECKEMMLAVELQLPEWEIRDTWNGVDCYSFSISVRKKESNDVA